MTDVMIDGVCNKNIAWCYYRYYQVADYLSNKKLRKTNTGWVTTIWLLRVVDKDKPGNSDRTDGKQQEHKIWDFFPCFDHWHYIQLYLILSYIQCIIFFFVNELFLSNSFFYYYNICYRVFVIIMFWMGIWHTYTYLHKAFKCKYASESVA